MAKFAKTSTGLLCKAGWETFSRTSPRLWNPKNDAEKSLPSSDGTSHGRRKLCPTRMLSLERPLTRFNSETEVL